MSNYKVNKSESDAALRNLWASAEVAPEGEEEEEEEPEANPTPKAEANPTAKPEADSTADKKPMSFEELAKLWKDAEENPTPAQKARQEAWKRKQKIKLRQQKIKMMGFDSREIKRYRDFPTEVLPPVLRDLVKQAAKAMGCAEAFVAAPALTVVAAAIGTTRELKLKDDWRVPPMIWTAMIGSSGTLKSPPLKLARKPVLEMEWEADADRADKMQQYKEEKMCYEESVKNWREQNRKKSTEPVPPPVEPTPPVYTRYFASDTTIEGLGRILNDNPRGILVIRDELNGWLGGMDQYKPGKGGDVAHYLEMYNGETMTVDRKGDDCPLKVRSAAVCISGGIQPQVFAKAIASDHRYNGLTARLLICWPPRPTRRWIDYTMDADVEHNYGAMIKRLYLLQGADNPLTGETGLPVAIKLTPDAHEVMKDFVNRHGLQGDGLDREEEEVKAAWSKLEEYPARLALGLHYAKWASQPWPEQCDEFSQLTPFEEDVSAETMQAAVTLTEWFTDEMLRVYSQLKEENLRAYYRELIDWIYQKGGRITERQIQQGRRSIQNARAAEEACQCIVEDGHGYWEKKGKTRELVLHPAESVYASIDSPQETAEV